MKVLITGWFSFINGHATAGDLLVRDVICTWLEQSGFLYHIAVAPPFEGDVDWGAVNPEEYDLILFVCGPFQKGELEAEFLSHFKNSRIIGINLSIPIPITNWNPWDLLIERDSSERANPDLSFASTQPLVPVVGICLVEDREGAMTKEAFAAIQRLVSSRDMAVVHINTRLDIDSNNHLRSPAEVETLLARMDVVVTTRLHGSVLALKNGVPVIAIDPDPGGAKVRRQMETLGWPVVFNIDTLTDEDLQNALSYCLTNEARNEARACHVRALQTIDGIRADFTSALLQQEIWKRTSNKREVTWQARTDIVLPSAFASDVNQVAEPQRARSIFSKIVRRAKRLARQTVKRIVLATLR